LSAQARQSGAVGLAMETVHYGSAQMHQVLATSIYDGPLGYGTLSSRVGRRTWRVRPPHFPLGQIPQSSSSVGGGRSLQGPRMITIIKGVQ
jgi:hypothetical protein